MQKMQVQFFRLINLTKEIEVAFEDFEEVEILEPGIKKDLINGDKIFIINPHDNYNIRPSINEDGSVGYYHYLPTIRFRGFEYEGRKFR